MIAKLDITQFPSPCFVTDLGRLRANAAILNEVQERTGAKILLALKAFSQYATFDVLSRAKHGPLWGCCASSPDEARLAREEFGGEVHAHAAAFSQDDLREVLRYADHVVFNSLSQWRALRGMAQTAGKNAGREGNLNSSRRVECGLRLNPEHSEGAVPIYDPCSPGSRLGVRKASLERELAADPALLDGLCGMHFHTLCEQDADALARTLDAVEDKFGKYFAGICQGPGQELGQRIKWLNFGGGHHITRPGYNLDLLCRCILRVRDRYGVQVYLEPGEAVALNAGLLVCTVLDIVEADLPIAILDTSAACHMPDVLEMPYRPGLLTANLVSAGNLGERAHTYRLGGKSCLAGDVIGEYSFDQPLEIGQRLAFTDMAIYSMVKTTTFNGLRLPSLATWDPDLDQVCINRIFAYEDFKSRL